MVPQKRFFLLLIVFHFITLNEVSAQEIFTRFRSVIHSIDTNTCKTAEKFSIDEEDGTYIMRDFKFHPNGRLYAITRAGILEIDAITWTLRDIIPWTQFTAPPQFNVPHLADGIIFDEEGIGMISGGSIEGNLFFYYDMQDRKLIKERIIYREEYSPALAPFSNKVGKYFFVGIQKQDSLLFDFETLRYVYIPTWPLFADHFGAFYNSGVENNPCAENPVLLAFSEYEEKWSIIKADIFDGKLSALCAEEINIRSTSITTPTDFRDSPLRIDLDADNSSGHRTAGYYDTLTTCRREVPVMDADMELYTCGAEVDYISFRLRNYDNPRLPEEMIYSEDFPGQLEEPSPGRYVWKNTYDADQDKIKEYLRSLRYRADWTDPDEKERVVMTTMHVGGDSTTSWSVYQLETDEVFAGQDTTITYCSIEGVIDLVDYFSPDASPNGRLEPVPAGGGTLIDARVDREEEYLYIVEKGNCADTAVLKLNYIKAPEDPEPVIVCPGEGLWYKLPPASYSEINWWDGSHKDSIWLEVSQDTTFYVETVVEDTCRWLMRVPVRVREVAGLAGEDQTHTFCAGDPELDLNVLLPVAPGMDRRLEPVLSGGDLIFQPGEDAAREYQYILSLGSCADTALITLEESATGTISLEAFRLCSGSETKVGIPPGNYQNTRWWNGDTGDSTTVSSVDSGPFTVEAEKDGCTYQGEVDVTMVPDVILPDDYPDQITICAGQPRAIPVSGLDSVGWRDAIYYPGEEITINREGTFTLKGYQAGCYAEKSITVDELADPSAGYNKTVEWCPQTALSIGLPEDNPNWTFRWKDNHDSSGRVIDSTGRYSFLIESDLCEFTGFYDVIESTDCDDDCTVSIPNAISPNGDGINDNLEVFSSCNIQVTEIRIFDKWGGELYRVQGGEVKPAVWADLPPGVVMVQVWYETNGGVMKTIGGGVLVVK